MPFALWIVRALFHKAIFISSVCPRSLLSLHFWHISSWSSLSSFILSICVIHVRVPLSALSVRVCLLPDLVFHIIVMASTRGMFCLYQVCHHIYIIKSLHSITGTSLLLLFIFSHFLLCTIIGVWTLLCWPIQQCNVWVDCPLLFVIYVNDLPKGCNPTWICLRMMQRS